MVIFRKILFLKCNQLYLLRAYHILGIFLNSGGKPEREKRKEKSLCPHVAYSLVGEIEDKTQIVKYIVHHFICLKKNKPGEGTNKAGSQGRDSI